VFCFGKIVPGTLTPAKLAAARSDLRGKFGTASVQLRDRAAFLAPKRHQMKHLDSKRRPEAHPAVTICVQVVYKKAGLKGLKMDLSNAESTTDS
jgi:hypothetical protein